MSEGSIAVAALSAGAMMRLEVAGVPVCVVHASDDQFYAFEDCCPHEGAPLSDGYLEGIELECPLHASIFDVRTGAVLGPPARRPLACWRVTVTDGVVRLARPGA